MWKRSNNAPASVAGVGFFGKLPAAADFVHSGAGEPIVEELRSWVERGVERAHVRGEVWNQAYEQGVAQYFLMRSKSGDQCLTGVILPSRDAVGRRFPLVAYAGVETAPLAESPHVGILVLQPWLEHVEATLRHAVQLGVPELSQLIQNLVPPSLHDIVAYRGEYAEFARLSSIEAVWATVFGHAQAAEAPHGLNIIVQAVMPVRGQESPDTPLGVRLPVGASGVAGVAFWVDLVRTAAGWQRTIPTAFWSQAGEASAITVQLGVPPATAFSELWLPDANSEHLCDLTQSAPVDWHAALAQCPPAVAQTLAQPQAPIGQLLAALSG